MPFSEVRPDGSDPCDSAAAGHCERFTAAVYGGAWDTRPRETVGRPGTEQGNTSRGVISAMLTSSHLFITLVNGLLLTRIEHNCASGLASCTDVIIYNHGFPDSSVVPTAMTDFDAAGSTPEHGFFSTRMPRKWCEHVLKQLDDAAFVAFNTRGVPGSSQRAPDAVETAPAEFEHKTLTGDLHDIEAVTVFMRQHCPDARITVCGMSTGAFLALAYAARSDLHPTGGVAGCIALACVDDIPSSASLDFSDQQRASFDEEGFCWKEFFPHGGRDNPQLWKLSRTYYDSYTEFPCAAELAAALSVPTLLLHGSEDRHVPPSHGQALFQTLRTHSSARTELLMLDKGNHFLSSNAALKKALAAVQRFLISLRPAD